MTFLSRGKSDEEALNVSALLCISKAYIFGNYFRSIPLSQVAHTHTFFLPKGQFSLRYLPFLPDSLEKKTHFLN